MKAEREGGISKPPQVTEPPVGWMIGEDVVNGVISAAVMTVGQRPGIWQMALRALCNGADKTKEGTINAFLFRAMVDRLLEELRTLEDHQES